MREGILNVLNECIAVENNFQRRAAWTIVGQTTKQIEPQKGGDFSRGYTNKVREGGLNYKESIRSGLGMTQRRRRRPQSDSAIAYPGFRTIEQRQKP